MQALELTNGATLDSRLKKAAAKLAAEAANDPTAWLDRFYLQALSRPPTSAEHDLSLTLLGNPPTSESVADLVWALVNLPEFQLIR